MAKQKILIVDDDVVAARELEARLSGLGYEVTGIASSEAEALAATAVHELEDQFFTTAIDMLCFLDFNEFDSRLEESERG